MADASISVPETAAKSETGFVRAIGLFDGTMIVVGSMIGSGIFIVAAEIARETGSPAGLLLTWIITGMLTISAALSYGELAALFPHAGGQYVYLREAYSPLGGSLSFDFAERVDRSSHQSWVEICPEPLRAAACCDGDDCVYHVPQYAGCAAWQAHSKHFHERKNAFVGRPGHSRYFCRPECRRHFR